MTSSSFEDVYRIQTARIMELERELTAAKKEIESLRKDAERYLWLRQFGSRAAIYVGADKGKSMEIAQMQQLDDAIDAARKLEERGEK